MRDDKHGEGNGAVGAQRQQQAAKPVACALPVCGAAQQRIIQFDVLGGGCEDADVEDKERGLRAGHSAAQGAWAAAEQGRANGRDAQ